jgi:hypothetical protein
MMFEVCDLDRPTSAEPEKIDAPAQKLLAQSSPFRTCENFLDRWFQR